MTTFAQENPYDSSRDAEVEQFKKLIRQDIYACVALFPKTEITWVTISVYTGGGGRKLELDTSHGRNYHWMAPWEKSCREDPGPYCILQDGDPGYAETSCMRDLFSKHEIPIADERTDEGVQIEYGIKFTVRLTEFDKLFIAAFHSQEPFDAAFEPLDTEDQEPAEATIAERLDALEQRVAEVKKDVDELPYSEWLHFQPWPDSTEEPVIDRKEVARLFTQAMPIFDNCFSDDSQIRSAKVIVKLDHTKKRIKTAASTKDEVEKRELRCLTKAVKALEMPPSDNNTLIIFSYTSPHYRDR